MKAYKELEKIQLSYRVEGDRALFSDPITKLSRELHSYPVPTYSALVGLSNSVYWKPSLTWQIDQVRVLNPIETYAEGTTPRMFNFGIPGTKVTKDSTYTLAYNTYLVNVAYEITIHPVFTKNPRYAKDLSYPKHMAMFNHAVKQGGRMGPFLGTSEASAYVTPSNADEEGYYDNSGVIDFGMMFHSFHYLPNGRINRLSLAHIQMVNGVIDFHAIRNQLISRRVNAATTQNDGGADK